MSTKLQLSLATGDYEIVRAIKEGIVKADGIDLTVMTSGQPIRTRRRN